MRQRILILGSTGSIGRSALEVVRSLGDSFEVAGLAAGRRHRELAAQAARCGTRHIAIGDASLAAALRREAPAGAGVYAGPEGLVELVERSACDCVISAIVGTAGLLATVRAVELGRKVAVASKETLVVAGPLMTALAERADSQLIPIDSEHSAVFQALHSGEHAEVRRIYLTSSGGPFRTWSRERIRAATCEQALAHPVWDMGPKITIDSATMMNKALEIVEARWLFDVPARKLEVLIHPEAVVHALVEFCDGCVIAQLGQPDMRLPIQYALTYPQRLPAPGAALDLTALGQLTFAAPDTTRFPALDLGFEVAGRGGSAGAVLNAANEAAVEAYRAGRIRFHEITELTADALRRHDWVASPDLDDLLEADRWARNEVLACLQC